VTSAVGSSAANALIANVTDVNQALNTLMVTVNGLSSATVNGVTVSGISINGSGNVTANVLAACGASNATFTLTVTDNQNVSSQATLMVSVTPNTAPTLGVYPATGPVAIGSNQTVTPDAAPNDNGSVVSLTASAPSFGGTFSGDPAAGVISITNASPAGTFIVTVNATDNCGATSTKTFTLVVSAVPTINGAMISRQQGAPASVSQIATVSDQIQAPNTLTVKVNGSSSATFNGVTVSGISIDGSGKVTASVVASCVASNATFNLSATNNLNQTGAAALIVNVTLSNPPVITLTPSITFLSPDHLYRTVTVADMVASANDDCDGNLISNVVIEKVTSDEPDNGPGTGNTINDIVIASDCKSAQLRAERAGGGDGRVYNVTLRVSDSSGNVTRAVFIVTVPHDQSGAPAVDSGVAFTVNCNCH
jgi:hypothetical protein